MRRALLVTHDGESFTHTFAGTVALVASFLGGWPTPLPASSINSGAPGGWLAYARSPRMRRASWMSLGMMVTRLAWMAARLVSSKRPTR